LPQQLCEAAIHSSSVISGSGFGSGAGTGCGGAGVGGAGGSVFIRVRYELSATRRAAILLHGFRRGAAM
jgi:hypothetical protein